MLTVLRISLFIVSLYGYSLMLRKYLGFHQKVSWIAAACLNVLVLYTAAYFKLIFIAAALMAVGGVALTGYILISDYRAGRLKRPAVNLFLLWLAGYFILFSWSLFQSHLEHYDNFSYWALIVKYLYTQGQLPDAATTIVEFTSYPMGSSLFVYYATVVAGFGDNVMLIGQFIFIFACIYSIFAVVRDGSRLLVMMMMFTMIAVFNYYNIAIRMNNLLVDFILPMLTLAGLAGMQRMQHDLKAMSAYVFLIGSVLTITKNSAIFFTVILFLYYISRVVKLVRVAKKPKIWLAASTVLATVGMTLVPYFAWSYHVKSTFVVSKHEVSLTSYTEIFSSKGQEIVQQITDRYLAEIFNLSTLSTQGILLANGLMIAAYLLFRFGFKRRTKLLKYLLLIDVIVVLYYIGIYGMFLFSMPTDEALVLAGFERYASSIVILALGIVTMALAHVGNDVMAAWRENAAVSLSLKNDTLLKKVYQYSSVILLFFATLLVLSENNGMLYNGRHYETSIPGRLNALVGSNMVLNEDRYLIITTSEVDVANYYVQMTGRYFLYSTHVDGREDFVMLDAVAFDELIKRYDKIVILEDHYTFNRMTEKVYGKVLEPGMYETSQFTMIPEPIE